METSGDRPFVDSDLHSRERVPYRDDRSPGGVVWAGGCRRVLPSVRGLVAVYGEFGSADYGDVGTGQDRDDGGSIILSQSIHLGQRSDHPLVPHVFSLLRLNLQHLPSCLHFTSSTPHTFFPGPAYLCSVALLVPCALASTIITERVEVPPPRAMFVDFPMQLDGWHGTSLALEKQYIDTLRLTTMSWPIIDSREGSQSICIPPIIGHKEKGSQHTRLKVVFQVVAGKSPL